MAGRSNISDLIAYDFAVDRDLRITSVSGDLEKLYGRSKAEVIGLQYGEVFPPLLNGKGDVVRACIESNRPRTLRGLCSQCFLGRVAADIYVKPLRGTSREATGAVVTIKPIHHCSVSGHLQESQALIDIGKVASTLAHGVRNPLNAIKGAVIYLRERYASDTTLREFTVIIEEEIIRLDSFISRFLGTSLVEFAASRTNVNDVVKKVEVSMSMQVHAKRIDARFSYGRVASLKINTFHLEQALFNVMNNALEAMSVGGRLTVRTFNHLEARGRFVAIEVTDTGAGLKTADQGRAVGSRKGKGRGFGLFITREILQYYGGYLEISSTKGISTTVRLLLPVTKQ